MHIDHFRILKILNRLGYLPQQTRTGSFRSDRLRIRSGMSKRNCQLRRVQQFLHSDNFDRLRLHRHMLIEYCNRLPPSHHRIDMHKQFYHPLIHQRQLRVQLYP